MSIAASREPVPFPAIVEAFILEITFEALREASIGIPKAIGQAAVQVGLVSAPMVIIVSKTGISSFIVSHFSLGLDLRLLRFPFMILAGTMGLYGVMVGIILILLHLVTLRSFGTPYLSPLAQLRLTDLKDVTVRAPWWAMWKRPILFGTSDSNRLAFQKRPKIPDEEDGD